MSIAEAQPCQSFTARDSNAIDRHDAKRDGLEYITGKGRAAVDPALVAFRRRHLLDEVTYGLIGPRTEHHMREAAPKVLTKSNCELVFLLRTLAAQ